MTYEHPIYTAASVDAQRHLSELNDSRLAFAGAYHGWGFHEDGCRSGITAAKSLGVHVVMPFARRGEDAATRHRLYRASRAGPVCVRGHAHASGPDQESLSLSEPAIGWWTTTGCRGLAGLVWRLARFERSDHSDVRAILDRARCGGGPDSDAGDASHPRLRLQSRSACSGATTRQEDASPSWPRCTTPTASVTPTFSDPTRHGRSEVNKELYVSPFYPVDGHYDIRVSEPGRISCRSR